MNKKRKKDVDSPQSLHSKTRDLYENRSRTLTMEAIERETGLPYRWLQNFPVSERPSVNRVQILFEFLSRHELNID